MEINIRNAELEDLDTIFNFICELEDEVFDYQIFTSIFEENLQNTNYVYYVAEIENQVVGFISFHTQKLLHHCGIVGEIQEFYVAQNFRGKHIGKYLIDTIKEYAKTYQLKSIEVTTNQLRIENVNIYNRLGFKLSHNKFTINITND